MKKFGFIGAGKMAGAIVRGMISSGAVKPCEIICACGNDDTGKNLSEQTGISLAKNIEQLLSSAEIIVAACKPQQLAQVAEAAAGEPLDFNPRGNHDCAPARMFLSRRQNSQGNAEYAGANIAGHFLLRTGIRAF